MYVINARNAHEALWYGLRNLLALGQRRDSRNGGVVVMPYPVTTVYREPLERVVFWLERDANPFFHFMEALWMLAGRDDVAWPARFARNIANYSDDGVTLHGAYGKRWRHHFGVKLTLEQDPSQLLDQLRWAVERLRNDPNDRRVVISMWDPYVDPGWAEYGGKDVPCNTHAYPWVGTDGRMHLTVCCRSNDAIWGAHGANSVHFAYLLEYLAGHLELSVGQLIQVSNNYHAYMDQFAKCEPIARKTVRPNPYHCGTVEPLTPLMQDPARWDEELLMFMENPDCGGFQEPFFRRVARPMLAAHDAYKDTEQPWQQRVRSATASAERIRATDWQAACLGWLDRRATELARRGS